MCRPVVVKATTKRASVSESSGRPSPALPAAAEEMGSKVKVKEDDTSTDGEQEERR